MSFCGCAVCGWGEGLFKVILMSKPTTVEVEVGYVVVELGL